MLASKSRAVPATYADIEALPAHVTGEIIYGALHTHRRPTLPHGTAATSLVSELYSPFKKGRGGPGGWTFIAEPELHLGPHIVVPDIAGWRTATTSSGQLSAAFATTPPDWLAEILSSSTRQIDRTDKMKIYAEYGVPHLWYVDPLDRTLIVYELRNGAYAGIVLLKNDDAVTAPPFEVHTFSLAELWG